LGLLEIGVYGVSLDIVDCLSHSIWQCTVGIARGQLF
jgi:hypothetical protein